MKLCHLGHSDTVSAPIQLGSEASDQSKIKLIYRGSSYDYNPRPVPASKKVVSNEPMVTLIYRGMTYKRQLQSSSRRQKTRAINWPWNWA